MTRLFVDGEPIEVTTNPSGNPTRFTWHGRRFQIERVWQQWKVDADWWSGDGQVSRGYHALTTADGMLLVLYEDRLTGGWFVGRVYD